MNPLFVREAIPNPDGTVDASMHPWMFAGSLTEGTGDCPASVTFSFASVKDLGLKVSALEAELPGAQMTCKYSTELREAEGYAFAFWLAHCPVQVAGMEAASARTLAVVVEAVPTPKGNGWMHRAHYTKAMKGADESQGVCHYGGWVVRREGAQ